MAVRNPLQAFATFVLESVGEHLWGFKPNLMAAFVAQKGAIPSLFWFAKNMPSYQRILEKWGPIRTHLLATQVSTMNGCAYCLHGHAHALELHYLQMTDRLFPLSESDIIALSGQRDDDILAGFEQALVKADLADEIFYIKRIDELYRQSTVTSIPSSTISASQSDRDCLHLINMFSVLNACGITSEVNLDMAHDPISKNRALRDRYAAMRRAERQPYPSATRHVPESDRCDRVVLNPADLYQDIYP